MKIPIVHYTFNAIAKTITFNDYPSIRLESVLLITNVTTNNIIYQFNDIDKGGTVNGNVLTLDFNTASQSDTDKLIIVFDDLTSQRSLINSDAFGKARVSQVTQTLDLKQIKDNLPLFWDRLNGGTGTQTWVSGEAGSNLTTTANADYAIAQTKQRTVYRSGQSTLIIMTMYNFNTQTNITKRIGPFQSSTTAPYNTVFDGIFLENANGVFSVQTWRSGTQTASVLRSSWDDPLDGTGPSGVTVDWSKNQKLVIDYQWLGVGRVRFALDINGFLYYFHIIESANVNQKVYMSSSNQPIRYEIRQTGVGSGTFTQICASASTEGAINTVGSQRSITSGTTAVSFSTIGTKFAALGIRLQSTFPNAIVDIASVEVVCINATTYYRWEIILNPTVAGTFTYTNVSDSSVQSAVGVTANTITGGVVLFGGIGTAQTTFSKAFEDALKIGSSINGIADTLVFSITPLTTGGNYHTTLNFTEYG